MKIFDHGKIRQERRRCHLRQRDVGEALGVAPATVSGWENGNIRVPADVLAELATLFGAKLDEFFSVKILMR